MSPEGTERRLAAILTFGEFELDFDRHELRRSGEPVELQPMPLRLMLYLAENRDRTVSKQELLDKLWPDALVTDTSLANALNQARQAVGDDGTAQRVIRTRKGHGYRFVAQPDLTFGPGGTWRTSRSSLRATLVFGIALLLGVVGVAGWRVLTPAPDESAAAVASGPVRSLAVLPFESVPPGDEQRAMARGLADALISELSRGSSLQVTALRSVIHIDTTRSAREIATELGVDAIVEGTLIQGEESVQVTANLIDARSDRQVWAARFEEKNGDLIALVRQLSESVASGIHAELAPRSARTIDPEAQRLYLRGRSEFAAYTFASLQRALALFVEAIGRDPSFAAAYTAKAQTQLFLYLTFYAQLGSFRAEVPQDVAYSEAREAALTALELEPGLADAHAILGSIHMYYDWDWEAAEREFRRAVEIGNGDPFLEAQYAVFLSLMGRGPEAETALRRTMERAPNSMALRELWAMMFINLRDLDRAQQEADALVRDYPDNYIALSTAIVILEGLRLWDEALRLNLRRGRLSGMPEEDLANFEATYRDGGQIALYRLMARRIEAGGPEGEIPRVAIARVYASLGDFDKAFEYLDLAIEEREPFVLPWLRAPFFPREFEQHPRFQAYIDRVGLPALPDAG